MVSRIKTGYPFYMAYVHSKIVQVSGTQINDTFYKVCPTSGIVQVKFLSDHLKGFYVEISLKKQNRLYCYSCNSSKSQIKFHLDALGNTLNNLTRCYQNTIPMSDCKIEPNKAIIQFFLNLYNLKILIKENNCVRNTDLHWLYPKQVL